MSKPSASKLLKTLAYGLASAVLYWAMVHYSEAIEHFAHATKTACVVGHDPDAQYYVKATVEACAEKSGHMVEGTWYFVFVPILVAFVMSYVHGAFTGLFWDVVGMKAKK